MNINDELDRIRGQGFTVTIGWGEYVVFAKADIFHNIRIKKDEKWDHFLYRAIMDFDAEDGV